ncbi:DUF4391 domain-containing protein [Comamonas aquatica]|nr:DUF4391 domain-containing protein [Comamonas aquatica]MDH0202174.1 DUF4391 domain-containing protein [Comamonas aquatica]MDH1447261.1 DUF4391 domain-containing protein [Comamonas aquatica]
MAIGADADEAVLGKYIEGTSTKARPEAEHAFVQSLAIARQPQASLHALYQGWIECVQALHAARRTGSYQAAATPEQAAAPGAVTAG